MNNYAQNWIRLGSLGRGWRSPAAGSLNSATGGFSIQLTVKLSHLNVLDSRCQNSKFQTPERLRANPESGVEKRDGSDTGRLLHAQDFITT